MVNYLIYNDFRYLRNKLENQFVVLFLLIIYDITLSVINYDNNFWGIKINIVLKKKKKYSYGLNINDIHIRCS